MLQGIEGDGGKELSPSINHASWEVASSCAEPSDQTLAPGSLSRDEILNQRMQ